MRPPNWFIVVFATVVGLGIGLVASVGAYIVHQDGANDVPVCPPGHHASFRGVAVHPDGSQDMLYDCDLGDQAVETYAPDAFTKTPTPTPTPDKNATVPK